MKLLEHQTIINRLKKKFIAFKLSRRKAIAFILAFAVLGGVGLLAIHALSPFVSVEPETGMLTPPANVVNGSNTSGGSYVEFGGAIKPQLTGIIDQNKLPPPAYLPPHVNAFDVYVKWSDVQPNSSSDLITTSIDNVITVARQNNMRLKLLLEAGQYAPDWVKNLPVTTGTRGAYNICNDASATGVPKCGTMPHFWEQNFQTTYASYMQQLANKYDNVSEIGQVDIAGCMTTFDEPLIREASSPPGQTPTNIQNYQTAGMTTAGDVQCEHAQIDSHKAWVHTQSYLAFNPYQQWDATTNPANPTFTTNEDFTESLIDYCRQTLGSRCVLGNDSIGKSYTVYNCSDIGGSGWSGKSDYARMYTKIKCTGAPIGLLSATPAKLALANTTETAAVNWAITQGAASVEPPAGYFDPNGNYTSTIYLSPAAIDGWATGFANNKKP